MKPLTKTVLDSVQEVKEKIITTRQLRNRISRHKAVLLVGKLRTVAIGKGLLLKVNVSLGLNNPKGIDTELTKLAYISSVGYAPDTLMDLSICRPPKPLYLYMIENSGGPVGTLPHYLCFDKNKGIDSHLLLEEIERQADAGVAFMTFHFTPKKKLYEKACLTRLTPVTSRGGGIVIKDMYINKRTDNVLSDNFDNITKILRKYGVVLSIGTTFRPATTTEALDEVQLEELYIQGEYITAAIKAEIPVIMEGMGHAPLKKIIQYAKLTKQLYNIPCMPLGPIPTDAAVGEDHISSAIGAAFMGYVGGADAINSVTREEHTGKIPSIDSILEGLKAARIASHAVNISRFPILDIADQRISRQRANHYTCVVDGGLFSESTRQRYSMGCSRCGIECPLAINYELAQESQV